MRSILWFLASGPRYSPSKVPFAFTRSNDFGELKERGKDAGLPYAYGSSTIEGDTSQSFEEQMSSLIRSVGAIAEAMKSEGAESFQLNALILEPHSAVEVSPSHMTFLASLGCHLQVVHQPNGKTPNAGR